MFSKNGQMLLGALGLLLSLAVTDSATAQGVSHSYVNLTRSSITSHVFVEQTVEGEFGQYSTSGVRKSNELDQPYSNAQDWKGYGIGTHFGVEWLKFVQFTAGHTFVNMSHKNDALESLNGSRLTAGIRFVFLAPLFNLELGAGAQGSRMDYQKQLERATFNGSGLYQEVGFNYFTSSKVSVFFRAKLANEHLVRTGGASSVKDMDTETTQMGAGFRLWL